MKMTSTQALTCLVVLLAVASDGATLKSVHLCLSPYQSADDAKLIRRRVSQFVLEAPPDTCVTLHDGYALTEITCFQIPRLRFDSPAERANRLSKPFQEMAQWYGQIAAKQAPAALANSGALRIPEIIQELTQRPSVEPFAVLLIGSPINLSLEEPGFSMAGGRVPSDGHIAADLTASIYGTASKEGRLRGTAVHLCYLRESTWSSQLLKQSVQRFWSLFVSRQDGMLVTFNADINKAFAMITQADLPPVGPYRLDASDLGLEMRVVGERAIPVRAERNAPADSASEATSVPPSPIPHDATTVEVCTVVPAKPTSAPVPVATEPPPPPVPVIPADTAAEACASPDPVEPTAAPEILVALGAPPITAEAPAETTKGVCSDPQLADLPPIPVPPRGRTGIAVWWAADADVDLYVSIRGEAELYYRNHKTKHGEYRRDVRKASPPDTERTWRDQWEYVEVGEDVPPSALVCFLNLYKVNRRNTLPIAGTVRVQYADGRSVETPFRFPVMKGNAGADSSNRRSSEYWLPIDLPPAVAKQ